MYCINLFSYIDGDCRIIKTDSFGNCLYSIDSLINEYIMSHNGISATKLDIKPHNYILTREDWNKSIRFWCTKSKYNTRKFIVKEMIKDVGYIYNNYRIIKHVSFEICKMDIEKVNTMSTSCSQDCSLADCTNMNYSYVIDELKEKFMDQKFIHQKSE